MMLLTLAAVATLIAISSLSNCSVESLILPTGWQCRSRYDMVQSKQGRGASSLPPRRVDRCLQFSSRGLVMQLQQQLTDPQYPTKIKSVLSKLTACTQRALQDRNSRIEIELPPGVDFGVEKRSKAAGAEDDRDRIGRSNREAARLITEMFSVLGDSTVVLFPSEAEAATARNLWSKSFRGKVLSIDVPSPKGYSNLRSRRFSAEQQEQALLATDGIYVPDGTEVLIVAGPRAKDMRKIRNMHEALGYGTLIILLNARLRAIQSTVGSATDVSVDLAATFENAFHYAPPVSSSSALSGRDLLVYHEYKSKWYLAEKLKLPKAKTGEAVNANGVLSSIGNLIDGLTAGSRTNDFSTLWEGDRNPTDEDIVKSVS